MLSKLQAATVLLHLLPLVSASPFHQKRADICGKKGWDRGNGNTYYDDSGKFATYSACSTKCTADSKCKSFGFGEDDGVCMLFNVALSGNFDADSSSGDTYYDRGCIAGGGGTSTTSSSSTSSSIKTTSSSTSKAVSSTTSSSVKTTSSSTKTTTTSKKTTTTSSKAAVATSSSLSSSKASTSSTSTTTTTTSSSSSSSSTPSVTIPDGCSDLPTAISMTTFNWFNSTHNLDCANPNYPAGSTVCWNQDKVCQPGEANCTCTPFCSTGLPNHAYQPLGFGPVDSIAVGMDGGATCYANNGQSIRRYELGEGHFDCGSAADQIGFYGDSSKDTGNIGRVYYNSYTACGGTRLARYEGTFPLLCTHDAGNNATCTTNLPMQIPLVSVS